MATLQELLKQKAELERLIASQQNESRASAIAEVKKLMAEHGLTAADLADQKTSSSKSAAKKGGTVAAKYRHPETGETWSGRGLQPKWLKAALADGRKVEDFKI
jgi:DNA-binding protein H-NS